MATTPTIEPTSLQAGDSVTWRRQLPDYPATDGWQLSYRLINAQARIDIVATADGADYLVVIPAATSALYAPGEYTMVAQVTRSTDRHTIGQQAITIKPDWAAAATGQDTRSTTRKALEAVQAYLADSNNIKAAEYEIAGRQLRRYSLSEVWAHRDRLAFEVSKEDAAARLAAGLPSNRRVFVRFGP